MDFFMVILYQVKKETQESWKEQIIHMSSLKKKVLIPVFATAMFVSGLGQTQQTAEASSVTVNQLTTEAYKYIGIKYKYGGTTTKGFDCSGYVQYVFKKLGLKLSRTTSTQYREGTAVAKKNLQPGDLVFFNTTGRGVSHVGIYLGNNKFIHSGVSRGIQVVGLNDSYWGKRYIGARRVATFVTEPAAPVVEQPVVEQPVVEEPVVTVPEVVATGEVKGDEIDLTRYASRAVVAEEIAKALGLDMTPRETGFIDVPASHPQSGAIAVMHELGIFSGNEEGRFNPSSPITRAQIAKVLVNAFDLNQQGDYLTFPDTADHWSAGSVSILASNGITNGKQDGTFGINDYLANRQLTTFMERLNTLQ